MLHGVSLRLTTMTFLMLEVCLSASSAMPFNGMLLPERSEVLESPGNVTVYRPK